MTNKIEFTNLTTEQKAEINGYKRTLEEKLGIPQTRSLYIKGLYDPKQTYAICGITPSQELFWKDELKFAGAKNIRKVESGELVILCFNAENMIENFIETDSYQ